MHVVPCYKPVSKTIWLVCPASPPSPPAPLVHRPHGGVGAVQRPQQGPRAVVQDRAPAAGGDDDDEGRHRPRRRRLVGGGWHAGQTNQMVSSRASEFQVGFLIVTTFETTFKRLKNVPF